jgi:hypothetical protein
MRRSAARVKFNSSAACSSKPSMGAYGGCLQPLRVSVPVLCTHTLGAVVADDVRLMEGEILLDQSMLTGESIPIATLEPTISPRSLRFN